VSSSLRTRKPASIRVAVGGIGHETNTFAPGRTGLNDFRARAFIAGDRLVRHARSSDSAIGGIIDGLESRGIEIAPLLFASAYPGPIVSRSAFTSLVSDLTGRLREIVGGGRLDGVLLSLHGAMVAETADDAEGVLLASIRQIVGANTPLVVVLDFHANISASMVQNANLLIGYDTYPHLDTRERGLEAVAHWETMHRTGITPERLVRSLPMLVPLPAQRTTPRTVWTGLLERAHELEQERGIIAITVAGGFPYSDVAFAGPSIVIACDCVDQRIERYADELALTLWNQRQTFIEPVLTIRQAIDAALGFDDSPIVIADTGDNPGAGATGRDATLLAELVDRGIERAIVAAIPDRAAVAHAWSAGEDGSFELSLPVGGWPNWHLRRFSASVIKLADGVFTNGGPMASGAVTRIGRTALLSIEGVLLVICEEPVQVTDPAIFAMVGIEPGEQRIIGIKSSVHYRAGFSSIANVMLDADCGGLSSSSLERFPYRNLRRPIFPLDPQAVMNV
jgi:microcystin degradation protein MlrC